MGLDLEDLVPCHEKALKTNQTVQPQTGTVVNLVMEEKSLLVSIKPVP
jgi:hypothetical protein